MRRRRRIWLWLRGFRMNDGTTCATAPVAWSRRHPERAMEILDELMLTRDPLWKRP